MEDVTFETFKKHKLICIPVGEYKDEIQYVKFGVKKAKAILDHIDEIERFVIAHEEGD